MNGAGTTCAVSVGARRWPCVWFAVLAAACASGGSRAGERSPSAAPPPGGTERDIARVVSEMRPGFRACYEQALAQDAKIQGCVRLAIVLNHDGAVSSVGAESALPPVLVDCLRAHATRSRFPPPSGGRGVVVLPIALTLEDRALGSKCGAETWVRTPAVLTNAARALVNRAVAIDDEAEQRALARQAVEAYRNAAVGWAAIARGSWPPNPEATFWEADARYWVVVLQAELDTIPPPDELSAAFSTARAARDGVPSHATVAAWYLIGLSDAVLRVEHLRHARSGGKEGTVKLPRFDPASESALPARVSVSRAARATLQARSEYLARAVDPRFARHRAVAALQAAELLLSHGQIDDALRWLEAAEREGCAHHRETADAAWALAEALRRRLTSAPATPDSPAPTGSGPCP